MNHLTRIVATVLFGALIASCILFPERIWGKPKSAVCVGEATPLLAGPLPHIETRRQPDIAPLTFWRPIKGLGPTPLSPSVINEFSLEEDQQWGRRLADGHKESWAHDPLIENYLHDQVEELLAVAPDYAKVFEPQIFIFCDPHHQRNAFSGGGGYIFFTVDRIASEPSEDSLAHSLAHELGHNALRHPTGQSTFERMLGVQRCALEAQLNRLEVRTNPQEFKILVYAVERMQRTEKEEYRLKRFLDEIEADVFAIQLLHKAGYDTGLATQAFWHDAQFFDHEQEHYDYHPHPATRAERMDLERNELANTPARTRQKDPARFAAVQARAKALIESKDSPAAPSSAPR